MQTTFTTVANACAYYRRLSDGSMWAVQLGQGQAISAVGPLLESETREPTFRHDFRLAPEGPAVPAFDWRMSDYEQVGGEWRREGVVMRRPATPQQRIYQ